MKTEQPDFRLVLPSMRGGGSERVGLQLANTWSELGHKVDLILVQATGPYLPRIAREVRVFDMDSPRILKGFFRLIRCLNQFPDVPLLIFGFDLALILTVAKMFGLIRCSIVFREGNDPNKNTKASLRWAYGTIIRFSNAVIAQNHSIAKALVRRGIPQGKISVIHNPRSTYGPKRTEAKQPGEPFLILAVGRLSAQKGFGRLLYGFAELKKQRRDARLVIVGEGNDRLELIRLAETLNIAEAFSLPGFTDNIEEWYRKSDLFVLSSIFEGQPNALIEAIIHERPVVCANTTGGVLELLHACGLKDHFIEGDFITEFSGAVARAIAVDQSKLTTASRLMLEFTDPFKIARQYEGVLRQLRCEKR